MGIPYAPGTPGAKAVGGGKGRPAGPGRPPGPGRPTGPGLPNIFGPGASALKATGKAGCPGSEGAVGPPSTGLYSVFAVTITGYDRELRPEGMFN